MNGMGKLLSRTLRVFAKNVHENAVNHGWWDEERSFAEKYGIDIGAIIAEKHEFNKTRLYKHGGKVI